MGDILAGTSLEIQQKNYLRTLQNAGEHLLGLINDILDLSRIESGQLELEQIPFSLKEQIEQAAELYGFRAIEKHLEFAVDFDPTLPEQVIGDPIRFKQIIVNLLGNAFKFTQSGKITLEAKLLSGNADRASVRIAVRDTGIGIPVTKQNSIFEKFTQVDASTTRRFGGTGLGLAICKRLTEMMTGTIRVESTEGQGSAFIFEIPFAISHALAIESKPVQPVAMSPGKIIRILLAEDSVDNRTVLSLFLKELAHELSVAENGAEAVDLFKQNDYEIVLMDNQMPVMDGLSAVRAIRLWENEQNRERTPILALTADSMKSDIENSTKAGCDGHITKPVRKATLLEEIRKHVPG